MARDLLHQKVMSLKKAILGSAVLLTVVGFATGASAQTCTSDKDCPQSYSCVTSGVVTQPLPACPPNADCAKLDVDAGQIVIMTCTPKACSTDADCGAGMVCHTETEESCSGGGGAPSCAPNTKCDAGAPVMTTSTCTITTTKLCAFKWQLPCNASADCGDGFACEPNVIGGCSGGGAVGSGGSTSVGTGHATAGAASTGSSSASVDGGSEPVRVDAGTVGVGPLDGGTVSSCTTTSSFPGYCSSKATTCTTDSDCPSTWKCTDVSIAVGVNTGTPMGGSTGAPAATGGALAIPADASVAKACVSPLGGGYGYPLRGGASTETTPQASGTSGTAGTSGAKAGGTGNTPGASNTGAASSTSGCSMAGGGAESAGLLLLAFVALGRARRRSRP